MTTEEKNKKSLFRTNLKNNFKKILRPQQRKLKTLNSFLEFRFS